MSRAISFFISSLSRHCVRSSTSGPSHICADVTVATLRWTQGQSLALAASACAPPSAMALAAIRPVIVLDRVMASSLNSERRHNDAPGIAPHLNRFDDAQLLQVDHGHVIRCAVGGEQELFIGRQGELPHTLADEQIFLDLEGLSLDHGDTVGGAERHKGAFPVL